MSYKGSNRSLPEIAAEIDVDAIVEGSVLRAGNKVRITVQLIRADGEEDLWEEVYDRDISDMLAVRSEVAKNIAQQLKLVLAPSSAAEI